MPLIDAALLGARRSAGARKRWRDAARLVSTRWEVFLAAERRRARLPSPPTPQRSTPRRPRQQRWRASCQTTPRKERAAWNFDLSHAGSQPKQAGSRSSPSRRWRGWQR